MELGQEALAGESCLALQRAASWALRGAANTLCVPKKRESRDAAAGAIANCRA